MEHNINNNEAGINSNNFGSVSQYSKFYSQLQSQKGMLSDTVRTSCYCRSITPNNFLDKVVMDVGTGSGILAMFSAKAGAKKVYGIEFSSCANYAKKLIESNNLQNKIEIINKKIEDIKENEIEKVDIIVSEPLGVLLVNERMLESFLIARNRFLKPEGIMNPSKATMFFLPFTDQALYENNINQVSFFNETNFFGINMSSLYSDALNEKMSKVVVGPYSSQCHVSNIPIAKTFDFQKIKIEELLNFSIYLEFIINFPCLIHGLASWFDAELYNNIILSTSPNNPITHWYQTRLLFKVPLAVNQGQKIKGVITFKANKEQSYDIYLKLGIEGTEYFVENNYLLKDYELYGFDNFGNKA